MFRINVQVVDNYAFTRAVDRQTSLPKEPMRMIRSVSNTTEPSALAEQSDLITETPPVLTRWKIALNCIAVAICMIAGALLPTGAFASVTAEAVEFFRSYGSVVVAAMAVTTLVVADMMSWPLLTQTRRK